MLIYEALPESGIDDRFMTAAANALHYNATTKIEVNGKNMIFGYADCPTQARISPTTGGHLGSGSAKGRSRLYLLQAFKDDMIAGLCDQLNAQQMAAKNSEYENRLAILHAHYLEALRNDRSLVHLGEQM